MDSATEFDPDTRSQTADTHPGSERKPDKLSALYLLYLVFYFTPWAFQLPSLWDGLIGVTAVTSFIPVYLYAVQNDFRHDGGLSPHRVLIGAGYASILAFALAPVHGMSGNFHIFAITLLAGLHPKLLALTAMGVLSITYLLVSWNLGVTPFELGLSQFIAVIAGLATLAGYESDRRSTAREHGLKREAELAALRERERIARDLHDVLGHTLTTLAVKSELAAKLIDVDANRARHEITGIHDTVRTTLKDVRSAVAGMHVTTLDRELIRARSALNAVGVALEVEGAPPAITCGASQSALGLAVREAVTNIIRHAGATRVQIRCLEPSGVEISDNGKGGEFVTGTGLDGMRRRIEALGGCMNLRTSPAGGVLLALTLPATQPQEPNP